MLKSITKEQKVQLYSFPLLIIYSTLSLYILPYGSFSYAVFLLPIVLVSVIYEIMTERIKFKPSDIIISLTLLFCAVAYNYSDNKMADALTMPALLFVCRYPQSINRKILYPLYLISLASIVYQLMSYTHHSTGVRVLSIIDPNFSGYIILLFFLFCFKNKYIFGVILALACAFNFFSRAYFLSLLVFGIGWFNETNIVKMFYKKLKNLLPKRIPIVFVMLVFNFFILFFSVSYIDMHSQDSFSDNLERTDLNRLTNVNDNSNYKRWFANKEALDFLVENPDILFFGVRNSEQIKTKETAHNSMLHILLHRGLIFSAVYLIGLRVVIGRVYQPHNLKYILAPLATTFFLHALLTGAKIIFLVAILTLKPPKGKLML